MGIKQIGRPAVLSAQSVNNLREYLGFRHVVRNLYGSELDPAHIDKLVEGYPALWLQVSKELSRFVDWLLELANQLDPIG